jgi:Sec-independent protein translocase protein TatA
LGSALRNFKKSVKEGQEEGDNAEQGKIDDKSQKSVIEGEAAKKEKDNA